MKLKVILSIIVVFLFFCTKSEVYSQNVSVTASVNPDATDLQFDFQALSAQEIFPQNSTLEYQITYGSDAFTPIPIILNANWEEGTIENTMTAVGVVNYVDGSATNAYGSTQPVIDLINNRITWTINSFPGQTRDATVKYSIKTNNIYKGSNLVNFVNRAELTSVNLTLPDISVGKKYLYDLSLEPTPTPTSTQTSSQQSGSATSTPIPSAIYPTPTTGLSINLNKNFRINQLDLAEVTSDSIKILISVNYSSIVRVFYGLHPDRLDESVNSEVYAINNEIKLSKLIPETDYFLRIEAINRNGLLIKSDIYRFKTARQSDVPNISKKSVIITSAYNILTDPVLTVDRQNENTPVIVLPSNQVFEFKFSLNNLKSAKRIQLYIQNKNVLGISSDLNYAGPAGLELTDAVEVSPGVFSGSLNAPLVPGNYEVIARISDTEGNIVTQKLAELRVSEKLRVLSTQSRKPIEGARVLLYYFNHKSKAFETLPPQVFKFKNPMFTDIRGEINATLAQGKYLAEVSAIGYQSIKTEFVIGLNPDEDYPVINLQKEPFNILTSIRHYLSISIDAAGATKLYIQNLSNSNRFFELNTLIVLSILVVLTIYSFIIRIHIPMHSFWDFFIHHNKMIINQNRLNEIIAGSLFDKTKSTAVSGANVYLIDKKKNKVVNHTLTDNKGYFRLMKLRNNNYAIEVMKDGYEPAIIDEGDLKQESGRYMINIDNKPRADSWSRRVQNAVTRIFSLMFEVLMVITLIFEVSLGYALGWDKALPFIMISIINIYVWITRSYTLKSD